MSVLSDIQSFCYRINIPAPTALVSSTDPGTLQLIHLYMAVCEELRQGKCWPQQKRTHTFETTSGRTKYPLPPDFYAPLQDTLWNEDENSRLVGPVSDADFTYNLYGITNSGTDFSWRIFGPDSNVSTSTSGGQFQINPTPDSTAQTITFEYLTKSLFVPKSWLPSTVYAIGDIVSANGNNYLCDTNGTSSSTPPSGTGSNIADGTTQWDYISTPFIVLLNDTDNSLFDSDLVKLGLRAKFFEEKGEDFNPAFAEFEAKISQAQARWHGSHIGSMIRKGSRPSYTVPYRNWSL